MEAMRREFEGEELIESPEELCFISIPGQSGYFVIPMRDIEYEGRETDAPNQLCAVHHPSLCSQPETSIPPARWIKVRVVTSGASAEIPSGFYPMCLNCHTIAVGDVSYANYCPGCGGRIVHDEL